MINQQSQSHMQITPEINDDSRLTETGSLEAAIPARIISTFKPIIESPFGLNSIRRRSVKSPSKFDSKCRIDASGNFFSPKGCRQRKLAGYVRYIKVIGGERNKICLKKINCTCFERFLAKDVCACYVSPSRLMTKISKARLWAISNFETSLARFYGFRLKRTNFRRSSRLRYLRSKHPMIKIVFKKRYVSKWVGAKQRSRYRIIVLE